MQKTVMHCCTAFVYHILLHQVKGRPYDIDIVYQRENKNLVAVVEVPIFTILRVVFLTRRAWNPAVDAQPALGYGWR